MAAPESIRKQVHHLRPRDLERFPIWEHALDEEGEPGQDEETVRPRPDLSEADPADGIMFVRAELIADDGTRYDGYVYASTEFDLGLMQPTIVTDAGQVNFWYGAFPPKRSEIERDYRLLGKTPEELFPVKFRAVVQHEGAALEGQVPAFLHLESPESDEVVEVK